MMELRDQRPDLTVKYAKFPWELENCDDGDEPEQPPEQQPQQQPPPPPPPPEQAL
jgi:hypothetical protein